MFFDRKRLERELNRRPVVGFTVSTFDLFHAGHVAMLQEAREACDYLIVGLLADPARDRPAEKNAPVQSLLERYVQVSGCCYVDEVIPLDSERDIVNALLLINPDIRIVGEEYRNAPLLTGEGLCPVHFNRHRHSFSSSELRERILDSEGRRLRRAVFLDRDGVVSRSYVRDGRPYPPATIEELEILPDALEALSNLANYGFTLIIITNQPEVRRGTLRRESVEQINDEIRRKLPVQDILTCYHADDDDCNCRKPRPGLLISASQRHHLNLARSFMIGDRWSDIDAGYNAGCRTILIERGYRERGPTWKPDARVSSLREAADWIIKRELGGGENVANNEHA